MGGFIGFGRWLTRIFGSPVLTGVNGAARIGSREVKFLDRAKRNLSEGILQVYLSLIKNESVGIEDDQIPS